MPPFDNVSELISPFVLKIQDYKIFMYLFVCGIYIFVFDVATYCIINRTPSAEIKRSRILSEFRAYKL